MIVGSANRNRNRGPVHSIHMDCHGLGEERRITPRTSHHALHLALVLTDAHPRCIGSHRNMLEHARARRAVPRAEEEPPDRKFGARYRAQNGL